MILYQLHIGENMYIYFILWVGSNPSWYVSSQQFPVEAEEYQEKPHS